MSLVKCVNGVPVEMSMEEEEEITAEWKANAIAIVSPTKRPVDEIISDPGQISDLKSALGLK